MVVGCHIVGTNDDKMGPLTFKVNGQGHSSYNGCTSH